MKNITWIVILIFSSNALAGPCSKLIQEKAKEARTVSSVEDGFDYQQTKNKMMAISSAKLRDVWLKGQFHQKDSKSKTKVVVGKPLSKKEERAIEEEYGDGRPVGPSKPQLDPKQSDRSFYLKHLAALALIANHGVLGKTTPEKTLEVLNKVMDHPEDPVGAFYDPNSQVDQYLVKIMNGSLDVDKLKGSEVQDLEKGLKALDLYLLRASQTRRPNQREFGLNVDRFVGHVIRIGHLQDIHDLCFKDGPEDPVYAGT